jgi:hypothetical protein
MVKILLSSCDVNCSSEYIAQNIFRTSDIPLKFIFYYKPTDLPVRYSSLLI